MKQINQKIIFKNDNKNFGVKVDVDYYLNVIIIRTSMNEKYQYYKTFLGAPDDIKYDNDNKATEVSWIRPLSELDIKFILKNSKKK